MASGNILPSESTKLLFIEYDLVTRGIVDQFGVLPPNIDSDTCIHASHVRSV